MVELVVKAIRRMRLLRARGSLGLVNSPDLERIWTWFRLCAGVCTFFAGLLLGIRWGWLGGVVAGLLSGVVVADATWRLLKPGISSLSAMALDITVIGMGMISVSLTPAGVGAPLIYMMVLPALLLPLRTAWLMMVYAVAWAAVALSGVAIFTMPVEASSGIVTALAYLIFATLTVALVIVVAATLERGNRARSEFLASVSHEIRTPLTSIVGWSEMLAADGDDLTVEDFIGGIRLIESEAGELSQLVDDILTAARLETGAVTVACERVDVNSVVRSVLDVSMPDFVDVVQRPKDQPHAIADPWRMRQILRNLFTNAQRYGGPQIWVEISVAGSSCSVTVCDNGDGVAPDLRRRLFEPYVRGGIARGTQAPIGLGLSISLSLARLMNGDLSYHRVDGITRFTLELPRAPSSRINSVNDGQVSNDDLTVRQALRSGTN